MDAITITTPEQHFTYASRGINVTPNPPCVGEPTSIAILLNNPGAAALTVERIAVKIARFGMGLHWEELPPLGPFIIAADPTQSTEIAQEWTPTTGGHRCVRAAIHVDSLQQPLMVGCNLQIVESTATQRAWQVPFRLGNPGRERAPLVLAVNAAEPVRAAIYARNRHVRAGEPIWLEPGEEIDAMLVLRAHTPATIDTTPTVEAYIHGQLIDGIAVHLLRPAYVLACIQDAERAHTDDFLTLVSAK
jgi:hypothetical protein